MHISLCTNFLNYERLIPSEGAVKPYSENLPDRRRRGKYDFLQMLSNFTFAIFTTLFATPLAQLAGHVMF